jgi:hypothetical protein
MPRSSKPLGLLVDLYLPDALTNVFIASGIDASNMRLTHRQRVRGIAGISVIRALGHICPRGSGPSIGARFRCAGAEKLYRFSSGHEPS